MQAQVINEPDQITWKWTTHRQCTHSEISNHALASVRSFWVKKEEGLVHCTRPELFTRDYSARRSDREPATTLDILLSSRDHTMHLARDHYLEGSR
jgi:hypothetical protein